MSDQQPPRSREEARALLRSIRREIRDAKIRQGRLTPQTMREMEIWRAGIAERFGLPDPEPSTTTVDSPGTPDGSRDLTLTPRARRRRRQPRGTGLGHRPPEDSPPPGGVA
jgi:hypothetical protein